jgi:hypothetical protein
MWSKEKEGRELAGKFVFALQSLAGDSELDDDAIRAVDAISAVFAKPVAEMSNEASGGSRRYSTSHKGVSKDPPPTCLS